MATLFILALVVTALVLLAFTAEEWGVDSRTGIGDDHQRGVSGGVL